MERLTEDALALARAGAKTSPMEVVDLAELVTDASRGDGADDNTSGLSLDFDIERPVWYPCRPGEMFRAVQNLAVNARRHAGGGAITLKQEDNGSVTIAIADNGPGVPEDIINRLTEPFFRGDAARSTEGSGLGLAIARACVEAHGGTLELSNRPTGTGLMATIHLPAAPPSGPLKQPA
jgi:signal transduction histidine kinase